jgi:hypothetical protein
MTWGRKNGDASNCSSYPVICTYDGMQSRLRESYLEMANDNSAEVSPVGAAWKYVRDNHPTIELYNADESHPSAAGSYLAACVHYASIYKKSPVGASYTFSLTTSDAAILQNAAKLIVMDSLSNWNFGVRDVASDFTNMAISGSEFQFTNTSQNATDLLWDFGDGNTSTLENPTHEYSTAGTYIVSLTASSICGSDNTNQSVSSLTNDIENLSSKDISVIINSNNIQLLFEMDKDLNIQLVSIEGKIISAKNVNGQRITIPAPLVSGMYFLVINDIKNNEINTQKIYIP